MKRSRERTSRGAVMVEFAIALPLLMLMLSGVANLGSMLWQIQQFSDAARHGARIAANRSNDSILGSPRPCSVGTDSLTFIAQQAAQSYINTNNLDPMNWWEDPVATIVSGGWSDGATDFPNSSFIQVEISTNTAVTQNCVICYSNILSYLDISVRSVFLVEGACT